MPHLRTAAGQHETDDSRSIRAVVVGVPARNEERHLESAIRAVLAAADRADDVTTAVVLALDSCDDSSVEIALALAAEDPRVIVLEDTWGNAGAARRAAIDAGISAAMADGGIDIGEIWVATTDADTVVPPDWVAAHRDHGRAGTAAVAGIVDILLDDDATPAVMDIFTRTYVVESDTHHHVHGANMGVRGDVYLSAGGFAAIDVAEDHALWNVIQNAGHRCVATTALRVSTSGRRVGRAVGGFADRLESLVGVAGVSPTGDGGLALEVAG